MTYQEVIGAAKEAAKINNVNFVVCEYQEYWWRKRQYNYYSQTMFSVLRQTTPLVKLLTITPSGTIAQ